ncbi:MAG TPA: efflux RND transporter permease subunit [Polyangiaceae bacterium]|nr:efflux RND transporter permease subunit [Polyangiaceae bacterium]
MIGRIIELSAKYRWFVLTLYVAVVTLAYASAKGVELDAIPDLSDPQVIVFTEWKGRSPTLVEDQITYPISSSLLAAPRVTAVRGYSMFGMSFVHVLFEEGTDVYWARSRVLETMSGIQAKLPAEVAPVLGPDATGIGWVYEYALVDKTGKHDLAELRTLQDYTLRYALESVPGVAQVATVGGYERQYQVTLDPEKLRAYGLGVGDVADAVRRSNGEVGGRLLEMSGREYFVRGRGYLENLAQLSEIAIRSGPGGAPVRVGDVGEVRFGADLRRGVADLDGKGETVGAIVMARHGENALQVIERVKTRTGELGSALPAGVEVVPVYDRSSLIERAIKTLKTALLEEAVTVSLVIVLFLLHFRSALLPIISLPIAVLLAFIPMRALGIPATIMSLGGIAIAIGATVDAEIVMIEACHKKLEGAPPGLDEAGRRALLNQAAKEVTPAIFFSLVIIALSFIPVFGLNGQAGRLFKPLAYTKTFVMLAAALVSITLAPALRDLLVRGEIPREERHPVSRAIMAVYRPFVYVALRRPKTTLAIGLFAVLSAVPPLLRLGTEFMPALNEGDVLYMPTTLPGLSIEEAKRQLQRQDRVLAAFPEVKSVFGKAGRAESPTDPAPLSMVETVVQLRPQGEWPRVRERRWHTGRAPAALGGPLRAIWPEERPETWDELIAKMNAALRMPGFTNAFTMPIKTRVDMLTTGVRTPVGVKVFGHDLASIERAGADLEAVLRGVRGSRSVLYERSLGGVYVDVVPKREALARYGLRVADLNDIVSSAIGGEAVSTTVEGRRRFSVNVRYQEDFRSTPDKLRQVLVPLAPLARAAGEAGRSVALGEVADVVVTEGPPMLRDEAGLLVGYVYVDVEPSRDLGGYVADAKAAVAAAQAKGAVRLAPGTYLRWTGEYELMEQMRERMTFLIPLSLLAVAVLLYLQFKNLTEVFIVFLSIPFALVGSVWLLYLLDYRVSTAVLVGVIALVGLAAQTGVVMIVYIDHAFVRRLRAGKIRDLEDIIHAHTEGTVLRVRPKVMTVATMLIGLVPLLWATGSGADVMKRIAAPMVGGLLSSAFLTLELIPVVYTYWRYAQLQRSQRVGRPLAEVAGIDLSAEPTTATRGSPL